ncbi:Serine protease inhibitor 77Ba [Eumeta japonica]|uniref:Serine protease inhibitor 77Ba n=1 Tax=Eumeta variegata TaxID=151549 RepID=A0A4C1V1Z8_EUMVA|nr:Serine protease inhibitor 77Ba [Eumeta japonica]
MEAPLFLLIVTLPGILGGCTLERALPMFRRSVYNFNAELTTRIADYSENHFVSSSLSLWAVLSAAAEGAEGTTLEELEKVLHHHYYKCFTLKYYDILRNATTKDQDSTLERSGVVVVDESIGVLDDYRRSIARVGISEMKSMPFSDSEYAARAVNEYVRSVTHDAVGDLLTPEDFADRYLFLIDVIYFKGQWRLPFKAEETEVTPFYNEHEVQLGDVNMMFQIGNFKIAHITLIDATLIELPYGTNDRHSMLIFLPRPGQSISKVMNNLKRMSLKSIFFLLANESPQKAYLSMPRFKITSDLELKDLLDDMGLTKMFDEVEANFSSITAYPLYVSDVIQKASIEVTEEGTVAAAVSEVALEGRSMPLQITINKPFFFVIADKLNEMVLFNGAYSKPSLY